MNLPGIVFQRFIKFARYEARRNGVARHPPVRSSSFFTRIRCAFTRALKFALPYTTCPPLLSAPRNFLLLGEFLSEILCAGGAGRSADTTAGYARPRDNGPVFYCRQRRINICGRFLAASSSPLLGRKNDKEGYRPPPGNVEIHMEYASTVSAACRRRLRPESMRTLAPSAPSTVADRS